MTAFCVPNSASNLAHLFTETFQVVQETKQHASQCMLSVNKQVIYKKVCSESNLRSGPHNNNAPAHAPSSVQKFLANTVMTITLHPLYFRILVPCAFVHFPEIQVGIIQEQSQATPAAFQTKDIH